MNKQDFRVIIVLQFIITILADLGSIAPPETFELIAVGDEFLWIRTQALT